MEDAEERGRERKEGGGKREERREGEREWGGGENGREERGKNMALASCTCKIRKELQ